MVQKARLDLSVAAALALAVLAGPALAQDGPLTTLMRPQPLAGPSSLGRNDDLTRSEQLFGDDPLASVNALSGTGSLSNQRPATRPADPAKPGKEAAGCDPRTTARPAFGLGSGGSGPGEYSRFVDNGRGADGKQPEAAAERPGTPPGDRPLYGGTDRPLWNDGTPSPARRGAARARVAGETRQRPAGGTRQAAGSDAPAGPAPAFDRPLWGDAVPAPSAAAVPCQTRQGMERPAKPHF